MLPYREHDRPNLQPACNSALGTRHTRRLNALYHLVAHVNAFVRPILSADPETSGIE